LLLRGCNAIAFKAKLIKLWFQPVIYATELLTAQQELPEAAKTKQSQPEIYEDAKEKLQL